MKETWSNSQSYYQMSHKVLIIVDVQNLQERGITTIYLAGLTTEYCIAYSALHAKELGYQVFVIDDACRGVELHQGDVEKAREKMRKAGIVLTHV